MSAKPRIELFVSDLQVSVDFYQRVLGFELVASRADVSRAYTPLRLGGIEVGLNVKSLLKETHPIQASGWPIAQPLSRRSWGLTDFRVIDPDG